MKITAPLTLEQQFIVKEATPSLLALPKPVFQPDVIKAIRSQGRTLPFPIYAAITKALNTPEADPKPDPEPEAKATVEGTISALKVDLNTTGWEPMPLVSKPIIGGFSATPTRPLTDFPKAFSTHYNPLKPRKPAKPALTVKVLRGFQEILGWKSTTYGRPDLKAALVFMERMIEHKNKKGE